MGSSPWRREAPYGLLVPLDARSLCVRAVWRWSSDEGGAIGISWCGFLVGMDEAGGRRIGGERSEAEGVVAGRPVRSIFRGGPGASNAERAPQRAAVGEGGGASVWTGAARLHGESLYAVDGAVASGPPQNVSRAMERDVRGRLGKKATSAFRSAPGAENIEGETFLPGGSHAGWDVRHTRRERAPGGGDPDSELSWRCPRGPRGPGAQGPGTRGARKLDRRVPAL